MKLKRTYKHILIGIVTVAAIGGGLMIYLLNQPHRDVQATKTDYAFKASQIVNEYLQDPNAANQKYLDEEGESKILEVTGTVHTIEEDFNGNKVILLKEDSDKAGVSCTMLDSLLKGLETSSETRIKGVIRSGASFDPDMGLYENVIMEDCKIIK